MPTAKSLLSARQYRSEARFLRAYYYFILVEGWGDVPFKTTSTQSVTGLSIPRTDKETIYDFIVKEMDECTDGLLSAAQLNYKPGRISKSTAWGILARVCLFRAGEHYRDHEAGDQTKIQEYFRQASTFAQKVMGEGHGLAENYWDVFIDLALTSTTLLPTKASGKSNLPEPTAQKHALKAVSET